MRGSMTQRHLFPSNHRQAAIGALRLGLAVGTITHTLKPWHIPMQEKKSKLNFDRPNSTMKNIRFEDELLTQIEAAAGKGQFSAWVKEACRMRLKGKNEES
jgi:hypothetical protein